MTLRKGSWFSGRHQSPQIVADLTASTTAPAAPHPAAQKRTLGKICAGGQDADGRSPGRPGQDLLAMAQAPSLAALTRNWDP